MFDMKAHQERALVKISSKLRENNRTQYVSACGTGKTLVGYEYIKRECAHADNVVIFFPSLALISQTYEAYLNYGLMSHSDNLLFVCSDETVSCLDEEDAFEIRVDEVDFPVTTDKERISEFLLGDNPKIIFSTYHSSIVLSDAYNTVGKHIDFALYDEAHKTASNGDSYYNYTLDDDNILIKKRLFMTATPKHRKLNSGDEDIEAYSMDNTSIYGKIAENYSIREAINDGIITSYKIIVSIMDSSEIEFIRESSGSSVLRNMDLKRAAKVYALHKAVKKYALKKGIVFAERRDKSKMFSEAYAEISTGFTKHIDSKLSSREIKKALDYFRDTDKGMLFNPSLLSEGIDVPTIDIVAFMEKVESVINIAQRIGRATRTDINNPDKVGYIFLPIFLSDEEEDIYNASFKSGAFNEMLEVISVVAEQDEVFYSVFAESKNNKEESLRRMSEFIEFDDNIGRLNISQKKHLEDRIRAITLEGIGYSWDKNFEVLKDFFEIKGELPMSTETYKGIGVGQWLSTQRKKYLLGTLPKDRTNRLDTLFLGDSWRIPKEVKFEKRWLDNLTLLVEYYEKHKRLPSGNTKEGIWITNQKDMHGKGLLSKVRIKLLDKAIPSWKENLFEKEFLKSFEALKDYYHIHNALPTVRVNHNGISIGEWLAHKKSDYKRNKLSKKYKELLDEIDKKWHMNTHDRKWHVFFDVFKEYYLEFNKTPKANTIYNNYKIGLWFYSQRNIFKKGKMGKERKILLDNINKEWRKGDSDKEEEDLKILEKFYKLHNRLPHSQEEINGVKIGVWLANQRSLYRNKKISQKRKEKLDKLCKGWEKGRDRIKESYIIKEGNTLRKIKIGKVFYKFCQKEGFSNLPRVVSEDKLYIVLEGSEESFHILIKYAVYYIHTKTKDIVSKNRKEIQSARSSAKQFICNIEKFGFDTSIFQKIEKQK